MITVADFWDMIMLNEFHNVLIKSVDTDDRLVYVEDSEALQRSKYDNYVIKHLATDWENRVYILWV